MLSRNKYQTCLVRKRGFHLHRGKTLVELWEWAGAWELTLVLTLEVQYTWSPQQCFQIRPCIPKSSPLPAVISEFDSQ